MEKAEEKHVDKPQNKTLEEPPEKPSDKHPEETPTIVAAERATPCSIQFCQKGLTIQGTLDPLTNSRVDTTLFFRTIQAPSRQPGWLPHQLNLGQIDYPAMTIKP